MPKPGYSMPTSVAAPHEVSTRTVLPRAEAFQFSNQHRRNKDVFTYLRDCSLSTTIASPLPLQICQRLPKHHVALPSTGPSLLLQAPFRTRQWPRDISFRPCEHRLPVRVPWETWV